MSVNTVLRTATLSIALLAAAVLRAQTNPSASIDRLIHDFLPPESEVGIAVYDLTRKCPLYTYRADKLCRPASTMKLLTAVATLSRPDADEPFRTEVWYKGTGDHNVLQGDLYVIGGFDPEFDDAAMDSLVDKLLTFPFNELHGNIYGDVSMKDSLYWGSGWAWDDNPASYQPYLTPIIYNKGKVTVTARPGASGGKASLECSPRSSFYKVHNQTVSRTPGAGKFNVSRNWLENGNQVTVSGNVAHEQTGEVNLYTTQDFFMHTFVERLRQKGIRLRDTLYVYREFTPDSTAVCLSRHECPIEQVLSQLLKESDNLNAEALLYRLAARDTDSKRVTAAQGLETLKQCIRQAGHAPEHYKIADGSGLSGYNYLTPQLLVDLLKFAYSDTDLFRKLYKALPEAGIDGTLKNRMKNGKAYRNVAAKTGTFTGISCLAGYLQTSDHRVLAFAVMNQNTLSSLAARLFQDRFCELLCR